MIFVIISLISINAIKIYINLETVLLIFVNDWSLIIFKLIQMLQIENIIACKNLWRYIYNTKVYFSSIFLILKDKTILVCSISAISTNLEI